MSPRLLVLALVALLLAVPPAVAALAAPAPEPVPLALDLSAAVDGTTLVAPEHLPAPGLGDGIGPGSLLHIRHDGVDGTFACTAAFVFQSGTRLLLGTAGHCVLPPGATATHGEGADHDPARTTVRVCFDSCAFGGQTGFILRGQMASLGPVVYARQHRGDTAVGEDFGLVEIPAALHEHVRAALPVWGGPSGEATSVPTGTPACLYGRAVVWGEAFPTMARAGSVVTRSAGGWWNAVIPGASGDSGSAVVTCGRADDGWHGDGALGILTHSLLGPSNVRYGTTLAQAQAMAQQDAKLSIALVTG